jgi:histidine triad (HIT) family protein
MPALARAVVEGMESEGLNVLVSDGRVAGQVIPHLHIHLIPRRGGDGVRLRWTPGSYAEGEIEQVAGKIKARLGGKVEQ